MTLQQCFDKLSEQYDKLDLPDFLDPANTGSNWYYIRYFVLPRAFNLSHEMKQNPERYKELEHVLAEHCMECPEDIDCIYDEYYTEDFLRQFTGKSIDLDKKIDDFPFEATYRFLLDSLIQQSINETWDYYLKLEKLPPESYHQVLEEVPDGLLQK